VGWIRKCGGGGLLFFGEKSRPIQDEKMGGEVNPRKESKERERERETDRQTDREEGYRETETETETETEKWNWSTEEEEMEHEMEEKSVFGWICFEPNTKTLQDLSVKKTLWRSQGGEK
jgi:hypothetical protein